MFTYVTVYAADGRALYSPVQVRLPMPVCIIVNGDYFCWSRKRSRYERNEPLACQVVEESAVPPPPGVGAAQQQQAEHEPPEF